MRRDGEPGDRAPACPDRHCREAEWGTFQVGRAAWQSAASGNLDSKGLSRSRCLAMPRAQPATRVGPIRSKKCVGEGGGSKESHSTHTLADRSGGRMRRSDDVLGSFVKGAGETS
jgi:hypothetical protein